MQAHPVAAHHGATLELDLCHACHGIWFDGNENLRMAPQGVVDLFRDLHAHRDDAQGPLSRDLNCPRCKRGLVQGADVVRTGRYITYRCPQRHGRFSTFSSFMIEKGFVRQLTKPEIADLPLERQAENLRWVSDEQLKNYVRPELRRALVHLRLQEVGSTAHLATFEDLRREFPRLEAQYPGVRFHLTGTSVLASRNLNQMIVDLASSLGSAAAIIFVVMAVGFRSLRLGLISIVPNLFPMAVTAAYLVVTGRPLQMTSVIVFSICLGIAVDDTIHFINRFQREMKLDGDVRAAVLRTYQAVGSAMIMTSLVLLAGFGSLQISEMPTTRLFSLLSCVTIFAAMVGDLVILPAMLCALVMSTGIAKPSSQVADSVEYADCNGDERYTAGCR